ncbi:hypothetical protein SAMN05216325_11233 [Nitrosomonas marina]|uniref:Uncharacterized protein n=1 Tax=Nitrosomonas marina TaxID=917 RepID=A0A1H8F8E9_9PROT|nr:hypothetical protein SAMN05216325_11233 [Nitrosomonas marina]
MCPRAGGRFTTALYIIIRITNLLQHASEYFGGFGIIIRIPYASRNMMCCETIQNIAGDQNYRMRVIAILREVIITPRF